MSYNKLSFTRLIKVVIIFILCTAATAFVFASGMYFIEDGYEYAPLFATLSLAVGCFFTSLYLGNSLGEKGLPIGFAVGAVVFALTVLITLLVNSGTVSVNVLLRFIILLLASLIGAVIGVNKKANKKFI